MSVSLSVHLQSANTSFPGSAAIAPSSLDFQNAIKNGNESLVKKMVGEGTFVNAALPNGELPLHLALRTNQPNIMTLLLANGADPEIKDFQNLSAIDHAALMKSESLLAVILGHKIGKDLKEVHEQIKCKGSASHIEELKTKLQKLTTVDIGKLAPLSQAVFQGNLPEALKYVTPQNINVLDANGLAPIHYAILSNQPKAVDSFLEFCSAQTLTSEGDNLLHFAAISGSIDILNKLISLGVDPNHKNSKGETPLHYAAATDNLLHVETLVKKGANPHLLASNGMSPLSLIGASAHERDPLALSKTQVVLFATTALYWLSTMADAGGWVTTDQAKLTAAVVNLAAIIGMNWSEFAVLVQNLDKSWKKVVAWVCHLGLAAIPPLNIGFQAWRTYHVVRNAFDGLKKCWHNVGNRTWAVARNVVVHAVNASHSIHNLWQTCAATYELALMAPYLYKMATATDEEAFLEAQAEFMEFMRSRHNFDPNETVPAANCANVATKDVAGLPTLARVMHQDLNPKCPEHAGLILSATFDMETFKAEGMSYLKKMYRKTAVEMHPDKNPGLNTNDAMVRVGDAKALLEAYAKNHF